MESIKSTFQINSNHQRIIFFDGECSLCNFWVNFLIQKQTNHQFHFASLQGETAKSIFTLSHQKKYILPPYHSVVVYVRTLGTVNESQFYIDSDAVLFIFSKFRFPWHLFSWLKIIPKKWRDLFYQQIAKNRYRWFGKRSTCRVPRPEERSWLLD